MLSNSVYSKYRYNVVTQTCKYSNVIELQSKVKYNYDQTASPQQYKLNLLMKYFVINAVI